MAITLEQAEKEYASVMAYIRSRAVPTLVYSYSNRKGGHHFCDEIGHNWFEILKKGAHFLLCSKCNMIIGMFDE